MRYGQSEDGTGAYMYIIRILNTEFRGITETSTYIMYVIPLAVPGKQYPSLLFDDMWSHQVSF